MVGFTQFLRQFIQFIQFIKSWLLFAGLLLLWLPSPSALAKKADIEFYVEKVGDGVFSLRPEKTWRINSTNVLYVGEKALVLVDGQADPHSAEQMLEAIHQRVSKLPIEFVILTHPHLDHVGGLSAIKRRYPSAKIIAHNSVAEFFRTHSEKERQWEVNDWLKPLRDSKQAALTEETDPAQKRELQRAVTQLSEYLDDIAAIQFVTPDITYDSAMSLAFGRDTLELAHHHPSHTPGDTTIYFPRQKVLVTGDLFHNLDPLFWAEASPELWVKTLDTITGYDARVYLGGHGDAIVDKTVLQSWRAYMVQLIAVVKAAKAQGESLEALQKRVNVQDVKALIERDYHLRIQAWSEKIMEFEDTVEAKLDRALAGLWAHY